MTTKKALEAIINKMADEFSRDSEKAVADALVYGVGFLAVDRFGRFSYSSIDQAIETVKFIEANRFENRKIIPSDT